MSDSFDADGITPDNWEPMLKCHKKPIVVFATQLNFPEGFEVMTRQGRVNGKPGDYLIIGAQGEKYPCDSAIFKETYEIIDD